MKKELKNVRIVTDNGAAVLLSQKRYDCLIQTLDLLANGSHERSRRRRGPAKTAVGRD